MQAANVRPARPISQAVTTAVKLRGNSQRARPESSTTAANSGNTA
jgi:hypothetical protein